MVARNESERGTRAMDRRPILEIFAQIITELFLCSAADRDDDVRRTTLFNQRKEILIAYFQAVARGNITILVNNWKCFPTRNRFPLQELYLRPAR